MPVAWQLEIVKHNKKIMSILKVRLEENDTTVTRPKRGDTLEDIPKPGHCSESLL